MCKFISLLNQPSKHPTPVQYLQIFRNTDKPSKLNSHPNEMLESYSKQSMNASPVNIKDQE